ncbi:hypothetical protein J6590_043599 [Homalodisca vitripennis]|nr:hypothetical protein J6590_043599 [Homalodisca vitripennis]
MESQISFRRCWGAGQIRRNTEPRRQKEIFDIGHLRHLVNIERRIRTAATISCPSYARVCTGALRLSLEYTTSVIFSPLVYIHKLSPRALTCLSAGNTFCHIHASTSLPFLSLRSRVPGWKGKGLAC